MTIGMLEALRDMSHGALQKQAESNVVMLTKCLGHLTNEDRLRCTGPRHGDAWRMRLRLLWFGSSGCARDWWSGDKNISAPNDFLDALIELGGVAGSERNCEFARALEAECGDLPVAFLESGRHVAIHIR